MKYIANPVEVEAFRIITVVGTTQDGSTQLLLENGEHVTAPAEMTSRICPLFNGDYWVVQSDGYVYLNPKNVFERKYSPVSFGGS